MGERTHKVEFRLDLERLWDTTVDEVESMVIIVTSIARLHEKNKDAQDETKLDLQDLIVVGSHIGEVRAFLCKFVWRDGRYMAAEEANPIVGFLTVRQLYQGLLAIAGNIPELAVPPANGGDSDLP
jgi:hypothetical protein